MPIFYYANRRWAVHKINGIVGLSTTNLKQYQNQGILFIGVGFQYSKAKLLANNREFNINNIIFQLENNQVNNAY